MSAAQAYKSSSLAERFGAAQSGDAAEFDALVQENLALVKFIVRRFLGRGKEYDDLYQTGCIGLVKAVRKFDASMDVRFSTYAVPLIMGEIRRFLRDDNAVHVSRSLHDLSVKIQQYRQECEKTQGSAPTLTEICERVGAEREAVLLALNASQPVKSLSEPVTEDNEVQLGDRIAVHSMEGIEDRLMLQKMLASLEEVERKIIVERFFERRTQKEVGGRYGYSQVQISRMENRILRKMRAYCDDNST